MGTKEKGGKKKEDGRHNISEVLVRTHNFLLGRSSNSIIYSEVSFVKKEGKRKMGMTGTLDECMSKLFDLYMEKRVKDPIVLEYLLLLRGEKGERVFSHEDADRLLGILRKDKEERGEHSTDEEDYMLKHIKTARTRDDLDIFEEAVLSLREGHVETDAVEGISVQDERLEAIQKKRGERRW